MGRERDIHYSGNMAKGTTRRGNTDTTLVRRTLEGNAASYGKMVDRYSARVIHVARMMLGDGHLAEDVAQEAFIRAYKALPRFEHRSKFSSWLFQIAINLCRDRIKSRARRARSVGQTALMALDGGDTRHAPRKRVLKREFAEGLQEAIGRLPCLYREAFILRHLDDLDYEEIGSITGVSPETARVRAYRARELMREELETDVDTYWRELCAREQEKKKKGKGAK